MVGKQNQEPLQYPTGTDSMTQEVKKGPAKKIDKSKSSRWYKNNLSFLKTGKVLLLTNKNVQVSASIDLGSSEKCPAVCA